LTNGVGACGWRGPAPLLATQPGPSAMETYLVSALLVALAEMGDRTQLLAIMLASRYRKPVPILAGIFAATIANHALAALAGFYLSSLLSATWFKYLIALSFVAMALWALVPDKEDDEERPTRLHLGVFLTTAVTFFLVEMGDKTQIATAALAARYHNVLLVAAGTTTGMMLANTPAVFLGHAVTRVLPIKALRIAAALLYLVLGIWGVATTAGWMK
jgi:putative Ca2+/H+ antiporter (TMEM165/GDT1 family)